MAGVSIPELFLGKWNQTTIKYSFVSAFPSYYTSEDKARVGTPEALTASQKQVIIGILNYIQTITGLTFEEVDPASGAVGDITFGTSSQAAQPGFTFAGVGQAGVGGDV
jgi:hypothetical protein